MVRWPLCSSRPNIPIFLLPITPLSLILTKFSEEPLPTRRKATSTHHHPSERRSHSCKLQEGHVPFTLIIASQESTRTHFPSLFLSGECETNLVTQLLANTYSSSGEAACAKSTTNTIEVLLSAIGSIVF